MPDKEKNIENYPIHNPEDESQGMELIDDKEKEKPNLKPGQFKCVSFEDWLKKANTFSGTHKYKVLDDENIDESHFPQGSSFGGSRTGLAKKTSYMQPGQGKKTTGSEGSMKYAGSINPLEALDIKAIKEKLDFDTISKLEKISDIIDIDVDEIIRGAMNESGGKDMTVKEMLEMLIKMYL